MPFASMGSIAETHAIRPHKAAPMVSERMVSKLPKRKLQENEWLQDDQETAKKVKRSQKKVCDGESTIVPSQNSGPKEGLQED